MSGLDQVIGVDGGNDAVDLHALLAAAAALLIGELVRRAASTRATSIDEFERLASACEHLARVERGLIHVESVDADGAVAERVPVSPAVLGLLRVGQPAETSADPAHNLD